MKLIVRWSWLLLIMSSVVLAEVTIDPFYLGLLEEGKQGIQSESWLDASETLKIACFGMLEEPQPLAECLVLLSIAEHESGESDAFQKTFGRILRLEEQYSAFSQSKITPTQRTRFQEIVLSAVPRSILDSSATFAAWKKPEPPPFEASMSVSEKRRALRRQIRKDPESPRWPLELAKLEISDGREERAEALLTSLLSKQDVDEAYCVRGRLRGQSQRWTEALEDLEKCSRITNDSQWIMAMLEVQMELGELAAAESMAMLLTLNHPASDESIRLLTRLRLRIRNRSDEVYLSEAEQEALRKIERELKTDLSRKELGRVRNELIELAERHPLDRELQHQVGEVAYRVSDWELAWDYLRREGGPGTDSPERLFYLAVAAHQLGHQGPAKDALTLALPYLSKTAIVETYTDRILN